MYYVVYFVIGLFFGSFFNVVGTRGPIKENYLTSRSHCDYCLHDLNWYELIPIFSYVFQKGRCNYCHKKIDKAHLGYELFTAILFISGYYLYGNTLTCLEYLTLSSMLVLIFVSDFKYMVILDSYLIVLTIIYSVLLIINYGLDFFFARLLTGLSLFVTVLIVKLLFDYIFKRESLGGGDVKLSFFMGLVLGYPLGLTAFMLSSFLALPYATLSLYLNKKNELPFGPFLISATYLVFIFSDKFSLVLEYLF